MYTGKEKCQMCGKTGGESHRDAKDNLCWKCEKELALLRANNIDSKIEYKRIRQHVCACRGDLNTHLHAFLQVIDNPNSKYTGSDDIISNWGDNCRCYTIDSRIISPLKDLFTALNKREWEYEKKIDNLPQQVKEAVNKERNIIFNKGVEHGRKLLFQLNKGEITISQFNEDVLKY